MVTKSMISLLAALWINPNACLAEQVDPVYEGILGKPYNLDVCADKPRGCKAIVQTLIDLEAKSNTGNGNQNKQTKTRPPPKRPASSKMKPIELNDGDFAEFVKSSENPSFVLFHAPWCGHCKTMMPDYEELARRMADKTVNIVRVDATENKELARKFKIQGFPTLIYFPKGSKPQTYRQGRSLEDFERYLSPYVKLVQKDPIKVKQLLSETQFREECANAPCFITLLPHLLYGGQSAGRKTAIEAIEKAANKDRESAEKSSFLWLEGGRDLEWEQSFVGSVGHPTTMAIDLRTNEVSILLKNSTDQTILAGFFETVFKGRARRQSFHKPSQPGLTTVAAWDGKDVVSDEL